jgi:hypothetical protein
MFYKNEITVMLVVNLKDCKSVRYEGLECALRYETRVREFCEKGKVILRILCGMKGGFESSVRYERRF